jgi:hypothetical protein
MVRPGLKRLRAAINVKVQPNKTGTSSMQGQFIKTQKGVVFNSAANTPYNKLSNSRTFIPTYTTAQKKADNQCKCVKKKEWPKSGTTILAKSWNGSWQ